MGGGPPPKNVEFQVVAVKEVHGLLVPVIGQAKVKFGQLKYELMVRSKIFTCMYGWMLHVCVPLELMNP